MKRVCFIGGSDIGSVFSSRFAGPRRLYYELAKRLKKDYDVCAIRQGESSRISNETGIKEWIVKRGPFYVFKVINRLKKINPDIIHGYGSLNAGLLIFFLKKFFNKKTIFTFTDFKPNVTNNYRILNSFDAVLVQTDYAKGRLVDYGVKKEVIHKITHGVEEEFYNARNCSKIRNLSKKIVLYYGDARYERGFDVLVDSIPKVNNDIFFLICIRRRWTNIKKRPLKNSKNVLFMDVHKYPCPIQDIIKSTDLVVLPFIRNTLEPPLTLMEVSAVGKPLITTDIGGNKEVISKDCILLKRNSPQELAEAINTFFSSKQTAKKMKFDWDTVIKKIKQIYYK